MTKTAAPKAPEVPPQARGGCYTMDPVTGAVARSDSEAAPPAPPAPEAQE